MRCEQCVHTKNNEVFVPLPHEDYMESMVNTDRYWEQATMQTFAALLLHSSHIESIANCPCQEPAAVIEDTAKMDLKAETKNIISVLYTAKHFTLLTVDLEKRHCTVIDGFAERKSSWITNWKDHVNYVLVKSRVLNAAPRWRFSTLLTKKEMYAEIDGNRWTLSHEPWIVQLNGYDCGPIVGMKLMEIFGRLPEGFDKDNVDWTLLRLQVGNEFRKVLQEVVKDLRVSKKKKNSDPQDTRPPTSPKKKVHPQVPRKRQHRTLASVELKVQKKFEKYILVMQQKGQP
jgi:hypothetical protein